MSVRRRRYGALGKIMFVSLLCVGLGLLCAPLPAAAADGPDALERRVVDELDRFTAWLDDNNSRGYVGEVGWPDASSGDASKWNALAERWFGRADAADLWVTGWATGEWWGDDYDLSIYENRIGDSESGVESANTQASVFEAHPSGPGYGRGVTVNGGEFGSPIIRQTSKFSNENPGRYQTRYHYDWQHTFDYLGRRGIDHVRIPFRWERLQPRLGGLLDEDEVRRLKATIGRAREAGIDVILDMHNYGAYYLDDGTQGVRRTIGSKQVTIAHFADVWRRISGTFGDVEGVIGYALMAEPYGMPSRKKMSPAEVWERASRQALSAIRSTGDETLVSVAGYAWSALARWHKVHPDAWIDDPAGNFLYEAHHYWDRDYSGDYGRSYASEVQWSADRGF
ncbi:MAG: glycoside hydrolase family 5 protein [Actinomycetota bacterium]|nr:glycoside hydrolase family 5 protein [Actinomycetota bacterium]